MFYNSPKVRNSIFEPLHTQQHDIEAKRLEQTSE